MRADGDLLALQTIRIAGSVPALMVRTDDGCDWIREFDARYYFRPDHRVNLHLLELFGRQFPRLRDDVFGYREFADIVQNRGGPQCL